jgi:hypothetical protein
MPIKIRGNFINPITTAHTKQGKRLLGHLWEYGKKF